MAAGVAVQIAQGYSPLRVRPVFPRALPQPADLALDSLRAGDVRSDHRQQQISRPLRDGACTSSRRWRCRPPASRITSIASARRRRSPTPTSTATAHSCSRSSGSGSTGSIAAILLAIVTNLLWVRGTESSWRVRMSLADGPLLARDFVAGCRRLPGADARRRRLHLLQHAHPQSLSHDLPDR